VKIPTALLRIAALSSLAALAYAPRLPGQGTGEPEGITLQEALDAVLEHGTQLQLGEQQVRAGEGALLAARAPFDARLTASLATERSNGASPSASGVPTSTLSRTVASSIALPKRFHSGVVITPRLELARTDISNVPDALTSRASVNLGVLVPLLRDRGGGTTAAAERAARHALDASELDARHSAAASVLAVAVAYWNDLAAEERLEVYRSSELRASRLVDDTRRLVEADERPAADLKQLLANLALKRAARLMAEQASVEAREQLALAIGSGGDGSPFPPAAITGFPDADGESAPGSVSTGADTDTVRQTEAFRRRADLAALRARRIAAEVQLEAAQNGLRQRLDLSVGLGYQGVASDRGFSGALSSFYRNVAGLDASVQLSYELPLASLAARGEALRSSAAYDQARIREAELARQISSGVRMAHQALRHGRDALLASREAVSLSREAVENEKRKFQLGMSTLFDVILAEDALTNAKLGEIAGEQAYAVAIARLRYETGTILDASGQKVRVNAGSLEREP
jgi:outer membrane protein TolC